MRYSLPFDNITTLASADTLKTLALIRVANTVGHRFRLRAVTGSFADDVPQDNNIHLRIHRVAYGTAGTAGSTVTAANMPKKDPGSIDCLMTGELNFSAEPTTFDNQGIWVIDMNDRGEFHREWDEDQAPRFIANSGCAFRAAPREAVASILTGCMEFELY